MKFNFPHDAIFKHEKKFFKNHFRNIITFKYKEY